MGLHVRDRDLHSTPIARLIVAEPQPALPRSGMPERELEAAGVGVVEVAGIEPASSDDEPGLLRAQLARRFLGPYTRASKS